jgi:hypothetical protein
MTAIADQLGLVDSQREFFPPMTGLQHHWGYISARFGPVEGSVDLIFYEFSAIGSVGGVEPFEGVPATRTAREVDVRALPIGCPVIIRQEFGESATVWPLGVEEIIYEDCPPGAPETFGTKVLDFIKRIFKGSD